MFEECTLKRMVQKTRRQVQNILAEPSNLQELMIPQHYKQFENETVFLLYDSRPGIDCLCVFGTQCNLDLLRHSYSFFSNRTFSTAPRHLFQQLYTIHIIHFGAVIPLLYAFLANKTVQTDQKLS